MEKFKKIFKKDKNVIIGALHFDPLLGYKDHPGKDRLKNDAMQDLDALIAGGVDAIIIENNYDYPHKERISIENRKYMVELGKKVASNCQLPIGVSVLWNDYESAFYIAKKIGAKFIRVPVFVDDVKTSYGTFLADPQAVIQTRSDMQAEDVLIFADIQVKHATILQPRPIEVSAQAAINAGADAIIVTGNWTGESPDVSDLKKIHHAVSKIPIIIGSGLNARNAMRLLSYCTGAIVSTSIKEGKSRQKEINIKSWHQRISTQKTTQLMLKIKNPT